MARRPSTKIKIPKKAPRKTQSETYLINRKYLGDEPTFTSTKEVDSSTLTRCYQWYNIFCDKKEAKEYMITFLKNTNQLDELKAFKKVPDNWINLTACWIARMYSRGAKLPDSCAEFFESRFQEMIDRDYAKGFFGRSEVVETEETVEVKKPSVQDRMTAILDKLMCDIEEEIDKEWLKSNFAGPREFKMYEWLVANEVPAVQAKRMYDYYEPLFREIEETDESAPEYWEGYTDTQFFGLHAFYKMIVEDLERYTQNEKKVRKPRTPKPVSSEKKLKDFKSQNFDNDLKIQSVQPIRILGAQELWTFSTKYNQLSVFRAADAKGLDVHRTAITGFNPNESFTKKLRAKDVPSVLKEVLDGGKVSLRNVLKNARGSDQKLQERMNENTLLLRVISK